VPRGSDSTSVPTDRQLDAAVRVLAERADPVGVVRLVEAWGEQGLPSRAARLAAAQAWFSLRLLDRATALVKEVLDESPEDLVAQRLLAEIYLERGWPQRARAPLAHLRERGEDVDALWARAHQEPTRPETQARTVEREGTLDEQIRLAEQFIATGSHLRATGMLERMRRAHPAHPRVRELLWGLAGDYSPGSLTLGELQRQLIPIMPVRLQTPVEEPEHTEFTESVKEADRFLEDENPESEPGRFPSLFKHGARPELLPADDPVESTQSSRIASPEEMAGPAVPEVTDYGHLLHAPATGGDTQIMLVLRPGEKAKEQRHRRRADTDQLRSTLDLQEYQKQMGMSAPSGSAEPGEVASLDGHEDLLEDEDRNMVFLTRAEAPAAPVEEAPDLARPMEVIEKHATPPPPRPQLPDPEPSLYPPYDVPPPARGGPGAALVVGLALVALLVFLGVAVLVFGVLDPAGVGSVRPDLVEALAEEDYGTLLRAEGALAGQAEESPAPELTAALAEARLVLWSDFNGDPSRLEYVEATLAQPGAIDARRMAFLRATAALAREDTSGARAAIGVHEPKDDEEQLLFARLWARTGDTARALEAFSRMAEPDAPRYTLALAEVLAAAGRVDAARTAVARLVGERPDHVAAQLASLELADGEHAQRVAAADIFLTRFRAAQLAPRLEGRANVVRARSYAGMGLVGKAREAADVGLARDGTNPALLYVVAADEVASGRSVSALTELEAVVKARPGDPAAQTARVLVLLDLDRVAEAEGAVSAMEAEQVLPDLVRTLAALVAVAGTQADPATPLGPAVATTPIGAYTRALVMVRQRDPGAFGAVQDARSAVEASVDPFLVRLGPRLAALAVTVADPADATRLAAEAETAAGTDPVAHVYLGRYFESSGRRALAAQHFDRAAELGRECGLALYERGRFYKGAPEGGGRTAEAWRAYLALAPSGPRAERVGATMRSP